MNKYQKLLSGAVLVLIVLNLALLGFKWKKNSFFNPHSLNENNRRVRMSDHLKEVLKLDNQQLKSFQKMHSEHQKRMEVLNHEMRILNHEIHKTIIENDSTSEMAISHKMDSLHLMIKNESIDFVKSLSYLCREDQKDGLLLMLEKLPDRRGYRGDQRSRVPGGKKQRNL